MGTLMTTRQQAILRELNLHPLWRLRPTESALPATQWAAHDPLRESVMPLQPAENSAVKNRVPEGTTAHTLQDSDWPQLKESVMNCAACKLRAGCTQTVFGVGDEKADWLFVGEGPGADEDIKGEPFVGQAGKLLDNMLAAIKLKRGINVYIANIVKCRPPGNRTPEDDEIAQCMPYLARQIQLMQPRLIVALGKTAAVSLLGRDGTLASLRGRMHEYQGIPLIATYHPAYLLRSPMEKAKAWQDFCLAIKTMDSITRGHL